MKEIVLTKGQVALVDDGDYGRLNRFKWHAFKGGNTFYAARISQCINKKQHRVFMHHEVIGRPPKGFDADHKNGQGIDNRRKNLRVVTRRQNSQNKKNIKKTSKYPGVCWVKLKNKWKAQITIKRKQNHIGYFTDEKKAFEAYKQAVNNLGEEVIGGI